ncbi:MAG: PD40 domain-containing protein [Chloroflexi bacterium]|nr:PD40 domain-containing protein [Chloroflexota bacterium]
MIQRILFLICLACLLLVGCGTEGEMVAEAAPTAAQLPAAETPIATETAQPTPTPNATPAPATHTPTLPPPTNTPTTTPQPTETQIATATSSLAFPLSPQGAIFFLWSTVPPPDGSDPSLTTDLYVAYPGNSPDRWDVRPLIPDLFGFTLMKASPDMSYLAILFSENEEQAWNEMRGVGLYNFEQKAFSNLTGSECCLYGFDWLPQSQAVLYSQVNNLFQIDIGEESSPSQLTDDWLSQSGTEVFNPVISPDGNWVAVTLSSNQMAVYNMTTGHFTTLAEEVPYPSSHRVITWSPNSQMLAFTSTFEQGLFVANMDSMAVVQLENVNTRCLPAWSSKTLLLAYTCDNSLFLWDAKTQVAEETVNGDIVGIPVWSPNGSTIAVNVVIGEKKGFLLIDPNDGRQQFLDTTDVAAPSLWPPAIWSPDGEWLLYLSEQPDQTGYYVMNKTNNIPYLVLNTTGLGTPHDLVWFHDVASLP